MIVLDTTVLIYAVGVDHSYRQPCRRIVQAIMDGEITATTTVEAIQEFTDVRARRRGRDDAAGHARDYIGLLSPLLVVEEAELREGLRVFVENGKLGAFDAILVAAAASAGAEAFVSADSAFASVPDIRHVIPDEAGVQELLESM